MTGTIFSSFFVVKRLKVYTNGSLYWCNIQGPHCAHQLDRLGGITITASKGCDLHRGRAQELRRWWAGLVQCGAWWGRLTTLRQQQLVRYLHQCRQSTIQGRRANLYLFLSNSQHHISPTIRQGSLIEPLHQGGNPQKKCNSLPNARLEVTVSIWNRLEEGEGGKCEQGAVHCKPLPHTGRAEIQPQVQHPPITCWWRTPLLHSIITNHRL